MNLLIVKKALKKNARIIIIGTLGVVTSIGAYYYYNENVVKTSPEYSIDRLYAAIDNGDKDTVYQLVNLYSIIDDTAKSVMLVNLTMDDWSNSSSVLNDLDHDKFVKAIADNILNNITSLHKIVYTGEESNVIANNIRLLGLQNLEFENATLNHSSDTPVLDITVHDSKKKDIKYVVHIKLRQDGKIWVLDQLIEADTVIKSRLVDYKQNLSEENKDIVRLFNKLMKVNNPNLSIKEKEVTVNDPDHKDKTIHQIQSKFIFEAPVLLDQSVQSANIVISLADKQSGRVIKEIPLTIKKPATSIVYEKELQAAETGDGSLLTGIKKDTIVTTVIIKSITTVDNKTYELHE